MPFRQTAPTTAPRPATGESCHCHALLFSNQSTDPSGHLADPKESLWAWFGSQLMDIPPWAGPDEALGKPDRLCLELFAAILVWHCIAHRVYGPSLFDRLAYACRVPCVVHTPFAPQDQNLWGGSGGWREDGTAPVFVEVQRAICLKPGPVDITSAFSEWPRLLEAAKVWQNGGKERKLVAAWAQGAKDLHLLFNWSMAVATPASYIFRWFKSQSQAASGRANLSFPHTSSYGRLIRWVTLMSIFVSVLLAGTLQPTILLQALGAISKPWFFSVQLGIPLNP